MSASNKIRNYLANLLQLDTLSAQLQNADRQINEISTQLEEAHKQLASLHEENNILRTQLNNCLQDSIQAQNAFFSNEMINLHQAITAERSTALEGRLADQYVALSKDLVSVMDSKLDYWCQSITTEQRKALETKLADQQLALDTRLGDRQLAIAQRLSSEFSSKLYELRRSIKMQANLPIRVVFLCELPSLWNSFHTVVTAMQSDPRFEVILVRLWYKAYNSDGCYHFEYSDFSKPSESIKQEFIDSYDPVTEQWLDLEALQPDYVFYMRPYDYYRHEDYHIETVSKYTKTCYIPYGMTFFGGDVEKLSWPVEFCSKLYYLFLNTPLRKAHLQEMLGHPANLDDEHLLCLGFPRMDLIAQYNSVPQKTSNQHTILWLPRWTTQENCCHFFDYKEILAQYALNNEDCKLILRPHPLCFNNFLQTGELTQTELDELKTLYKENDSLSLDEDGNYIPSFQSADILVADETSLIPEFYATGKPVVFCKRNSPFSHIKEAISPGLYIVENQDDLIKTLDLLCQGSDPLKDIRKEIIDTVLIPGGKPAGIQIKEQIEKDFWK